MKALNEEQRQPWDMAYGPKNAALERAGLEGEELVRWKYQRYVKDYLRCVASVDDGIGRILDDSLNLCLLQNKFFIMF